ncbi:DUF4258 domain-containing protein [Gracilimonas mengyeensis]|uniref:DUF4258 domain-containing protein n=1 Tax=Gracilimonas mengyeensis TaxID=1302730 RepID=A0A521CH34_9BACT|nr:DUF4258 domain-containing protein [Gracilimonas mengyeensis]SMO58749.1 protein of unknown function [Gracilimonas mengyeensis]
MSDFLVKIKQLVRNESVRISEHGYDELSDDKLSVREIILGIDHSLIVEEYPDYPKGPCILVLQQDKNGMPVHVLWGIPKGHNQPAVLITAYRPNQDQWSKDFLKRK